MIVYLKYFIVIVAAYLLGSVSFSILLSRAFGGDVRRHGSGNAGATNMARVYGLGAGFMTLGGDMVKAALAALLGKLLLGDWGMMCGGIFVMLGHCFPLFHDLKGGKGISVGGVLSFVVDWRVGLCVVGAFLLGAFGSKKVSVGSCLGAIAIIAAPILFHVSTPRLILGLVAGCLALFQHRGNIKRLIQGTEPDFKAKQ